MKTITGTVSVLALILATGTAAAQTKAPDPADAKFVAADVNKSGALEGAELNAFKADMAKIDTNKDGKIAKDEYAAAVKAGVIK